MYFYADSRGVFFIIIGVILVFLVAGDLLFRIIVGMLGLYLINYGCRLRGMPSMHQMLYAWFDRLQW